MANWTTETLLDHVQELLGEPIGGFYNISSRIALLNQAQRDLVEETRALTGSSSLAITQGVVDYNLPTDFLTFSNEAPYFTDSSSNVNRVTVVDANWLDRAIPQWQTVDTTGTPMYAVVRNATLTLYPSPDSGGTLTLPYVADPTPLAEMDDVPFNGIVRLNRFAPALAYRAAFVTNMGRAPQLAAMFKDLYDQQERLMRHHVRSSPQHKPGMRPTKED